MKLAKGRSNTLAIRIGRANTNRERPSTSCAGSSLETMMKISSNRNNVLASQPETRRLMKKMTTTPAKPPRLPRNRMLAYSCSKTSAMLAMAVTRTNISISTAIPTRSIFSNLRRRASPGSVDGTFSNWLSKPMRFLRPLSRDCDRMSFDTDRSLPGWQIRQHPRAQTVTWQSTSRDRSCLTQTRAAGT